LKASIKAREKKKNTGRTSTLKRNSEGLGGKFRGREKGNGGGERDRS